MGKNKEIQKKKVFYRDDELTENESLATYKHFVESSFGSVAPHTIYKFIVQTDDESNIISCSVSGKIIYHYIRGSYAYGLFIEGKSDIDEGGVYIANIDDVIDLRLNYEEQIADAKNDKVFYEVGRFFELLMKSNPTMLESLFVPQRCIKYEHPIMQNIKAHREEFLSKDCLNSFIGYAVSQIKKARGLKKMIVNPITERKEPLDFCYVPYKQGSTCIKNWLEYRGMNQRYCGLVCIPNMLCTYGCYYDWGEHFFTEGLTKQMLIDAAVTDNENLDIIKIDKDIKGLREDDGYVCEHSLEELEAMLKKAQLKNMVTTILDKYCNGADSATAVEDISKWFDKQQMIIGYRGIIGDDGDSNELRLSSVSKGESYVTLLNYNQDGYKTHCRKYHEYKEWEKNRNQERFRINVEKTHNYDAKNMSHCVRLLICATEIAEDDVFRVDREGIDRDFLLSIKNGELGYDELMAYTEKKQDEMNKAIEVSELRDSVDIDMANGLLREIRHMQIRGEV